MKIFSLIASFFLAISLINSSYASPVLKRAERLPEVTINGVNGFSLDYLELEAGKFYRLKLTSDGRDEYPVRSKDGFFESIFVNEVVVNDLEVKTTNIWGLEFDGEGTIELFFVPMRTGDFSIEVPGQRLDGFVTRITVK